MENVFVLPKENYKRRINPKRHYVEQVAHYLAKQTGVLFEECREYVLTQIAPGGQFEFKDPKMKFTHRIDFNDRHIEEDSILNYIETSLTQEDLLAPTLTAYVNPKIRESLYVKVIESDVKWRSVAKKKMFEEEMNAIKVEKKIRTLTDQNAIQMLTKTREVHLREHKIQKGTQGNKKTSTNSLSGAQTVASTPAFNKTSHPTLTSTCRTTSGYGNANNEKFVAGNRHYFSYDVTLANIISITTNTDYEQLKKTVELMGIVLPSPEQTMQCILYSSTMYWREKQLIARLYAYVKKLTPLERAAFVYTGDFYHFRKFNPDLVRSFLTELSKMIQDPCEDPVTAFKNAPDDVRELAMQICARYTKGMKIKDIFSYKEDELGTTVLDENNKPILAFPEIANVMGSTILNIQQTLYQFKPVIRTFWTSPNIPASLANFPTSVRRVALVSDTDSTIFTVQEWVQWYCGSMKFTETSVAICASMVFLASATITHILAIMSANFGISKDRIHQIAMKNEFRFDIFVPTQIAKHYYALIGRQEGNLYEKFKKEIKGVHLRSSNVPKEIIDKAHDMMENMIMMKIYRGEKISLDEVLKYVADIERSIIASIRKGDYVYLRLAQIKESESYTLDETKSPYQHYTLWQEVFAPKYGETVAPPYATIKVSTTLNSKRKMREWLDSMNDKELSNRMQCWLETNDKKNGIGTFQLPDQIISSTGIPDEVFSAMDIRRIIVDATNIFYIVLETLGFYLLDDGKTKLISDFY